MLLEVPFLDKAFNMSLQVVAIGSIVYVVLVEVAVLGPVTLLRISVHRAWLSKEI